MIWVLRFGVFVCGDGMDGLHFSFQISFLTFSKWFLRFSCAESRRCAESELRLVSFFVIAYACFACGNGRDGM